MDANLTETLLLEEEQAGPVTSRTDLEGHRYRRAALEPQLQALHEYVQSLYSRFHKLPRLADTQHIQWAEAIRKFPNLAIVVLDTTGVNDDSDIIRVMTANAQGEITHDWLTRPERQPGHANTRYTGIDRESLLKAPTLSEMWGQITDALAGHYILAYNLDFLRARLSENVLHYSLEPVMIIGECLMERARVYYNNYSSLKLVDLCAKIGHAMPRPATAQDRIIGQIAFIEAMCAGIMDVHYRPKTATSSGDDEIEDQYGGHPF